MEKRYLFTKIDKINNDIINISNEVQNEIIYNLMASAYENRGFKKFVNDTEKITSFCFMQENETEEGTEIIESIRIFTEL